MDLRVRPIFHRTPDHVRAHIFLCLLAYYVEWRMRQAWAELLFEDEQLEADRQQRDAVAPAEPSAAVKKKRRAALRRRGYPCIASRRCWTRWRRAAKTLAASSARGARRRSNNGPRRRRCKSGLSSCWACSQKRES